jgi:4-carboxymuconolactone decarboxylase
MDMHVSTSVRTILLLGVLGMLWGGRALAQNPVDSAGAAAAPRPDDVDPQSRNRLPLPIRDDMDDYGKKVFDKFLTDNPGDPLTHLRTPAGIRLYSPRIAEDLRDASLYLRNETGLGHRLTEIAILVEAREMDDQYVWASHEPAARRAGVEPAIIDIIKSNKPATALGEKETVIIAYGRELFEHKKISSPTFAAVLRLFGRRGTVDLASLMGVFTTISMLDETVDIQLPEGQKPSLPQR